MYVSTASGNHKTVILSLLPANDRRNGIKIHDKETETMNLCNQLQEYSTPSEMGIAWEPGDKTESVVRS